MSPRLAGLARHAPLAVDQAVSSGSNFVLALLVARSASPAGFGRFALAASVYWLALGAMRSLIAEPLLILRAKDTSSGARSELSAAVGLGVSVSLAGSAVGLLLTLLTGSGPIGWVLICLPVLIWQDLVRYSAFSLGRPRVALESDGGWLVLLLAIGAAAQLSGRQPSVGGWVLLWAACAVLPAVVASARTGVWPALAGRAAWWSRSRRQAGPMLGDFLVYTARDNLFVFLLPLVTSFALLGQVKAAMVANGPLSVLTTAASVAALPLLARRSGPDGVLPLRAGAMVSGGLAAVAGCWALVLLLLPPAWGAFLFGRSWTGVGVLPALIAAENAVLCLAQGAVLLLTSAGRPGRLLRARIALVPVGLVVPLAAAHYGGVRALGISLVGVAALIACVLWIVVGRLREPAVPAAAAQVAAG